MRREVRRGFPGVKTPCTAGTQRLRRGAERGAQRLPWSANPLYWWHAEVSTSPQKALYNTSRALPRDAETEKFRAGVYGGKGDASSFFKEPAYQRAAEVLQRDSPLILLARRGFHGAANCPISSWGFATASCAKTLPLIKHNFWQKRLQPALPQGGPRPRAEVSTLPQIAGCSPGGWPPSPPPKPTLPWGQIPPPRGPNRPPPKGDPAWAQRPPCPTQHGSPPFTWATSRGFASDALAAVTWAGREGTLEPNGPTPSLECLA